MAGFFSSSLGIAALVIGILVIIYFMSPKPKNVEAEEVSSPEEQLAVSSVPAAAEDKENQQDNLELVAAIMGALSVYLEVPASKLVIKSIKRVDGINSTWREHGLEDY